jgi:hypothetical protein
MEHCSIGVLRLANGAGGLECRVQRSSASGAQVKVRTMAPLPPELELHFGGDQIRATLLWQRGGVLGLRFDDYFHR